MFILTYLLTGYHGVFPISPALANYWLLELLIEVAILWLGPIVHIATRLTNRRVGRPIPRVHAWECACVGCTRRHAIRMARR